MLTYFSGVTVFVNPYTEPDEEDEKEKVKDEKNTEDEDNVSPSLLDLESLRSTYTQTGKRTHHFSNNLDMGTLGTPLIFYFDLLMCPVMSRIFPSVSPTFLT